MHERIRRLSVALLLAAVLLPGCSAMRYQNASIGKFTGSLDVRWIKPDRFIYVPNNADPFRFVTGAKRAIVPAIMYTDGGSIPRLFWNVPGYSPWGYAPAYIIHDWLFVAHHCKDPGYSDVTFEQSATILAEGIKTLMEDGTAPKDAVTFEAVYSAVGSPIAKQIWDSNPGCVRPPVTGFTDTEAPGELLFRIRVGR